MNALVRYMVHRSIIASSLFKTSVELLLIALESQKLNDIKFVEEQMDLLSQTIFKWMEKAHGASLTSEKVKKELSVSKN